MAPLYLDRLSLRYNIDMDDATYRRLDKQLRRYRNQVWVGRINGPMLIFLGLVFVVVAFDDTISIWQRAVSAAFGIISVSTGVWAFRLQFNRLPPELAAFEEYQRNVRRQIDNIPLGSDSYSKRKSAIGTSIQNASKCCDCSTRQQPVNTTAKQHHNDRCGHDPLDTA
jgi:hypothetical protein